MTGVFVVTTMSAVTTVLAVAGVVLTTGAMAAVGDLIPIAGRIVTVLGRLGAVCVRIVLGHVAPPRSLIPRTGINEQRNTREIPAAYVFLSVSGVSPP